MPAIDTAGTISSLTTAPLLDATVPTEEYACIGELAEGELVSWVVSLLTSFKVDVREVRLFTFGDDMMMKIEGVHHVYMLHFRL